MDFGRFRLKQKGFVSFVGIFDVAGQKNKDLSPWGGFGTFQAKRIRICLLLGDFGRFRLKEKGFVSMWGFWTFQAKRKGFCTR